MKIDYLVNKLKWLIHVYKKHFFIPDI